MLFVECKLWGLDQNLPVISCKFKMYVNRKYIKLQVCIDLFNAKSRYFTQDKLATYPLL